MATLIEALSTKNFVSFTPIPGGNTSPAHKIMTSPNEVTALMCGIVLHYIAARTGTGAVMVTRFVDIESFDEEELTEALQAVRDHTRRKYKFRHLKSVLAKYT